MSAETTERCASPIEVHLDGPVARIGIGSGAKHNALTGPAWHNLAARVRELGGTEDVRVIVIRGRAGSFCAGSDMSEWVDAETDRVHQSFARMESAFRAVEECPVPVLAEIQGVAAGAGCQLALACDLRLMADSARIGMPIARLGILASPAFAARISALAGPAVTRELLYTGRLLDAAAAVRLGLADRHLPDAELTSGTERFVRRIAGQPTAAVRAAKRAVSAALGPVRDATSDSHSPMISPADFRAGIADFLGS